ncbi:Replication protein [Serratia sp. UGAL515B_01]|uniref:Replication protein n=1 Tax=Serratia sp. UGAL515B_01 TaxID=2986763 RepID=UPI0029556C0E|nr:Replication protein [Serratia sp. UGAL515B_01]WON75540.1 Replication protein [Serratia sp. UGAL515B_01]
MASKVVARMSSHNWHRNADLIALRQQGYIPYTRRNDKSFVPKPMRVSARSESCEALNALSMALAANCDYNPDSDYAFEIMAPFEQIAAAMGCLHVYDNGRKAYDSPLHALSVQEQLDYVIVLRGQDTDYGQNKPLRLWLTERFFTSRGIAVDEIRQWLGQFRAWAIRNGLTESLRKKYERHLVRVERIGIDLKDKHSLRNRLKQIKRWVVSPDLAKEKQAKVEQLQEGLNELEKQNSERLDWVLDEAQKNLHSLARAKRQRQNPMYQAFVKWSTSSNVMPHEVVSLEQAVSKEHPGLRNRDPEVYYRLLLQRAGII